MDNFETVRLQTGKVFLKLFNDMRVLFVETISLKSVFLKTKTRKCNNINLNLDLFYDILQINAGSQEPEICMSCYSHERRISRLLLLLLCVHGKHQWWSVNLTTLFLGKLRPPKWLCGAHTFASN